MTGTLLFFGIFASNLLSVEIISDIILAADKTFFFLTDTLLFFGLIDSNLLSVEIISDIDFFLVASITSLTATSLAVTLLSGKDIFLFDSTT